MQKLIITVGLPASGKSSGIGKCMDKNEPYIGISRDKEGGKVIDLLPKVEKAIGLGHSVIVDCTFLTVESRKPFIDVGKELGVQVDCLWMDAKIEDCQINALHRMYDRYGEVFLTPEDIKNHAKAKADPNIFPIAALFKMNKSFEKPTADEGFDNINRVKFTRVFERQKYNGYSNRALFLDYDGTLRSLPDTATQKYPIKPSEVIVRPNAKKVLKEYISMGYRLIGVSNQSGIGKGVLTAEQAESCFEETNRQLGIDIEYSYCSHRIPPASCYCRKPQAGMAIPYIHKYKLDVPECITVGDMTSDKTFATRLGMKFVYADEFFR